MFKTKYTGTLIQAIARSEEHENKSGSSAYAILIHKDPNKQFKIVVQLSVGPPLAITQRHQKLKPGEATGYSHLALCPLTFRFYPAVLAGFPGQ